MKQGLILTGAILLILFSCKKEEIPNLNLPAVTETGQNTLGFNLNNNVWTNYGRRCTLAGCSDNKVSAYLYKQPNGNFDLGIMADYTLMSETIDQSFSIHALNLTTVGTFPLDSSLNRGMTFIASRYNQSYKAYENQLINKCFLTITKFDTTNNIIAGTFNGILYNPMNLTDSIKIDLGRFDAQLDYKR